MKIRSAFLFIVLAGSFLIFDRPVFSADYGMSIGMSTWFAWWKPFYLEASNSRRVAHSYSVQPGFFYGPSLSFYFPRHIAVSSTFLYSKFKQKEKAVYTDDSGFMIMIPSWISTTVLRYDSDNVFSIGLARFLQLAIGFKYARYSYKMQQYLLVIFVNGTKTYDEYSPALGLNFIIPLMKRQLYILIGGSAVYSWCTVRVRARGFYTEPPYLPVPFIPTPGKFSKIGLNLTGGFAYLIEKANLTLSLGFRYQMFRLLKIDPTNKYMKISSAYDHFYGITAGAILRIDFPKTEGKDKNRDNSVLTPDA